nr:hypothetical protein Iba_chr11eCG7750 [Ipomoea batatas]
MERPTVIGRTDTTANPVNVGYFQFGSQQLAPNVQSAAAHQTFNVGRQLVAPLSLSLKMEMLKGKKIEILGGKFAWEYAEGRGGPITTPFSTCYIKAKAFHIATTATACHSTP